MLSPAAPQHAVSLLLSEAEAQASKMRAEATAFREHAVAQATAARESAEQEAKELRASLRAMSTELSQLAALVTQRLTVPGELPAEFAMPAEPHIEFGADVARRGFPAETVLPPPARTAAVGKLGATRPAGGLKARTAANSRRTPAREPRTRRGIAPGARPRTAPVKQPGGQPRQLRAARMVVAAVIGLLWFSAVSGATQIVLHGFPFFVFRSAGVGATSSNGLQEDQGPGQPDAPGTRHQAAALHHHSKHRYHRPPIHHARVST